MSQIEQAIKDIQDANPSITDEKASHLVESARLIQAAGAPGSIVDILRNIAKTLCSFKQSEEAYAEIERMGAKPQGFPKPNLRPPRQGRKG